MTFPPWYSLRFQIKPFLADNAGKSSFESNFAKYALDRVLAAEDGGVSKTIFLNDYLTVGSA